MNTILTYVRSLLGWAGEEPPNRTGFKRDRVDDGFLSEDEFPAFKRVKQIRRSTYPDAMSSSNVWEKEEKEGKNVRYVPIQVEGRHPSTSTPNERSRGKVRTVELVEVRKNGPTTSLKPRMHTPVRPVIHAVIDDDDEPEVTLVETKSDNLKKPTKLYINLDDYENEPDNDVIFVKKVTTPPPKKEYKFFVTKEGSDVTDDALHYSRLNRRSNDRSSVLSPKTYSKFKAPPGITKTYKKAPTPVARWMQPNKTEYVTQIRSRGLNGNRSTISEVFNLDEKRNYQELIRRVAGSAKPVSLSKPLEIINIADDAASFRSTMRSQRSALNELKFSEKSFLTSKENEASKEYDPVTVASINSSDSEIEIINSESSNSSIRIDPINTFKDSLKDKPVTANDWLAKLDSKYRKKRQDVQEKLKDARRESDIISKVNYEQKLAYLEHKLKHELSIPESLMEEPQPTVELPKLTPEQENLVSKALGSGPPNQLLVEKFNLRIHRRDLQTLAGLNWLNDEVINFYMNLLMQRSEERKDLPKVYATNTFFYPKLMQSGQAGLRRWTRKVDIFAHDLMVVPVHLGVHWCCSLIHFKEKKIDYLDSMGAPNNACLAALMQYLRDEHQDKKGAPFDESGWKTENLKKIPQQMNGSDCGMFACTFAEFSARAAPYSFTQAHMPALRRKAAFEILQAKLLL